MNKKIIKLAAGSLTAAYATAFSAMSAFAEGDSDTTTTAATASSSSAFFTLVLPLIIMFALLYFVAIKPQKKREKEMKEMQESLQVGDEIVTGGGIVGIIVRTGDDTVVIETGGERHKLRIKTWAITENVSAAERMREAKNAASAKSPLSSAKLVDDDEPEKKSKKKKSSDEEE